MQPTLLISANWPGMIYLNGRFAGECSAEEKLIAPVSPAGIGLSGISAADRQRRGAESKDPLCRGKAVGRARDVWALAWPGGAVELELFGEEEPAQEEILERIAFPEGTLLMGARDGEQTAVLKISMGSPGEIAGKQFAAGFRKAAYGSDRSFGSRRPCAHRALGGGRGGICAISSENAWMQGAPHWPLTPENTALCALEAEMLGLCGEAENYLGAELRNRGLLEEICRDAIGCGPMLCAHPTDEARWRCFSGGGEVSRGQAGVVLRRTGGGQTGALADCADRFGWEITAAKKDAWLGKEIRTDGR